MEKEHWKTFETFSPSLSPSLSPSPSPSPSVLLPRSSLASSSRSSLLALLSLHLSLLSLLAVLCAPHAAALFARRRPAAACSYNLVDTPSRGHGMDAELEAQVRALGCELIQSCGILLDLNQVGEGTARPPPLPLSTLPSRAAHDTHAAFSRCASVALCMSTSTRYRV